MRQREWVLVGLLVAVSLLALWALQRVLGTVFFAITVAYVLYPIRRRLVDRGVNRRIAAGAATIVGFLAVLALVVPLVWSIYRRRESLLAYLRSLPATFEIEVFGYSYPLDVASVFPAVRDYLADAAVTVAGQATIIGMKFFLFAFLVYAFLLKPHAAGDAVRRTVPAAYHDTVARFHERVRDTLYAIYVLQAATAFASFVVGWLVFAVLGYDAAFSLAVVAGILQFIPILGPSIVVGVIALSEVVAGDIEAAILVAVLGLVLVGFLPDAIVRPKLAPYTAGIPASLYFIGFAGGVLSIGLVGLIAGPLVVVLFAESVKLLGEHNGDGRSPDVPPGQEASGVVAGPPEGGDASTDADAGN